MRLPLAAPALRLQLACSGPLYPSRRSLCPRSRAWPRVTGRWQRVYEHLRSAIYCLPSPAVVKIHCVSRVLGLHISRRQAGRRTPRHNQWRPAQPQAPRTRRHDRPHARLAPGDDRRMEREASRSGRRRRQTPEKTSDWHTRLASNQRPAVLETAALRLVRTKRYMRRSARLVNQPTARLPRQLKSSVHQH